MRDAFIQPVHVDNSGCLVCGVVLGASSETCFIMTLRCHYCSGAQIRRVTTLKLNTRSDSAALISLITEDTVTTVQKQKTSHLLDLLPDAWSRVAAVVPS